MHIHPSSPNSDTTSLQSEESAAIKIQAGFRGFRVRKQLLHHQGRSTANGYRPARSVSSFRRRQQQRQAMENNSGSPSTISAAGGSFNGTSATPSAQLQRGGVRNSDSSEGSSIEDRCATKIQAGVRGFLVRKKQKIATDAATKIQAGFRGFKARKETQKMKQN